VDLLVILGTFIRGPGWYLFPPWQYWDVHKTVAITNMNLPELLGVRSEVGSWIVGFVALSVWLIAIPQAFWMARGKKSTTLQKLGIVRYWITAQLFMIMLGTVVKVVLRMGFSVKYVLATPWINV